MLNIHAAFARGHQRHPLRDAVDNHADVEFFFDVRALFHQQPFHNAAFRAGLVGDECHAENFRGGIAYLIDRFDHLDAAALATTTGVNLRLDDPDFAAE